MPFVQAITQRFRNGTDIVPVKQIHVSGRNSANFETSRYEVTPTESGIQIPAAEILSTSEQQESARIRHWLVVTRGRASFPEEVLLWIVWTHATNQMHFVKQAASGHRNGSKPGSDL